MGALQVERKAFETLRDGLLREHRGEYALLKGDSLRGLFQDEGAALREGYRLLGDREPFLVQRVERADEEIPAVLGAVSARK